MIRAMTKQHALRMPDELAAKVDERAGKVGLSRNAWLLKAIEWAVSQPTRTVTTEQKV